MEDISEMTALELLDFVINYPEYLTDPYYREARAEVHKRFFELKQEEDF